MPPKKLSLPSNLLKELGFLDTLPASVNKGRWESQGQHRKARRKAERSSKRRQQPSQGSVQNRRNSARHSQAPEDHDCDTSTSVVEEDPPSPPPPVLSTSTTRKRKRTDSDGKSSQVPPTRQTPKAARNNTAQDDAEIEALERKLGIRKDRKTLPKAFKDDGLLDLLDDSSDDDSEVPHKGKTEADEWLARKRLKAARSRERPRDDAVENTDASDLEEAEDDDSLSALEDGNEGHDDKGREEASDEASGSEDESSQDEDPFAVSGSDAEEHQPTMTRRRENPYVAPITDTSKYIPPSLRKRSGNDTDLEARIRRKTQGPVNRVTEANLISIVEEINQIYRDHPRGLVTNVLTDLLMAQICEPTSKPDTLLVLSAGFVAALHKVIGVDFAAHFLNAVVDRFQQEHAAAQRAVEQQQTPTKETSNLATVLSEMYMFRIVGSKLIFDYVRLLLSNLSELNAELLLRIVRMAGPQLRKDDPLALKDIVSLIRPAVTKIGEGNLSVRTKFMIETITDLKNNKVKAGSQDLATLSQHVTRMRKLLGTMDTTKTKATEPLRVGLGDIQNADKSGRWWLVGASWAGPRNSEQQRSNESGPAAGETDIGSDLNLGTDLDDLATGDDLTLIDYAELAREQGMNTDVRRAIFISLVAAADVNDAHLRILKLRLNKYNRREIPKVLVQCAGAQQYYNPYYTLVASKFCGDPRIKYAFQDVLWTLFRRLGEPLFGEEPEDEEEETMDNRRLINTAKMVGHLVVDCSISLDVLKPLNFAYVKETTSLVVEVMLITILQECLKVKQTSTDHALGKIFGTHVSSELARGLRYFLRQKVHKTDMVDGKKEARRVREACKVAECILERQEMSERD
ncbi:hypothetical protein SODALDRAFT_326851 [Sodiomyces alkalinus F11]|uniref:MI domain-containing protein n=1 Tax=Sodiomyces alkalinus (strain CBS 110278 / VKM F-3762 / F11) TaxID=1314773 RepID=A0A3N2Q7G8_SODAK|nr:hypothetical protein SODALDRAFT_326851 [Sodiomyces alkalinus F11]ROT42700.1 hypothetical protein SODALDRAFT_326851 [Sodiomyces alkalinus F11]